MAENSYAPEVEAAIETFKKVLGDRDDYTYIIAISKELGPRTLKGFSIGVCGYPENLQTLLANWVKENFTGVERSLDFIDGVKEEILFRYSAENEK